MPTARRESSAKRALANSYSTSCANTAAARRPSGQGSIQPSASRPRDGIANEQARDRATPWTRKYVVLLEAPIDHSRAPACRAHNRGIEQWILAGGLRLQAVIRVVRIAAALAQRDVLRRV